MGRFLAHRLLAGAVSILVMATVAFFAINILLPYDWATQFWQGAEAMREQLGLNRPLVVQWAEYMGQLLRLSLGDGYDGIPVAPRIMAVLPVTVTVFVVGGLLAYMLGQWLGRFVAWQRNKGVSAGVTAISILLLTSFPPLTLFLIEYIGADRVNLARIGLGFGPIIPSGLATTEPPPVAISTASLAVMLIVTLGVAIGGQAYGRRVGSRAIGLLALPVSLAGLILALSLLGIGMEALNVFLQPSLFVAFIAFIAISFGEVMLVMRAGMTAEKAEDYVPTARAKGMHPRSIRDRHVAPNAVIPALSRFFASIPYLLTGLIIIERQLGMRGLSWVFFDAIEHAHIPMLIGTLVVVGLLVTVLRLVLDVLHAVIDPRLVIDRPETTR